MFIKVQNQLINLSLVVAIQTSVIQNEYDYEVEKGRENLVIAYRLTFVFNHKNFLNFDFFNKANFESEYQRLESYLLKGSTSTFVIREEQKLSNEERENKRDYNMRTRD